MSFSFWNRNYRLDKMTLKDLWVAYLMHYTIQAYIALAAIGIYCAVQTYTPENTSRIVISILAAIFLYPFIWYVLHRYVLHGRVFIPLPDHGQNMETHPFRPSPRSP